MAEIKFYASDMHPGMVMRTLKESNISHTPFNKSRDLKNKVYYTFEILDDTDQHELLTFLILKSR